MKCQHSLPIYPIARMTAEKEQSQCATDAGALRALNSVSAIAKLTKDFQTEGDQLSISRWIVLLDGLS
jgi:hypothetical protein